LYVKDTAFELVNRVVNQYLLPSFIADEKLRISS